MFQNLKNYKTVSTPYTPFSNRVILNTLPMEEGMERSYTSIRKVKHYDLTKLRDPRFFKHQQLALQELADEFPDHEIFIMARKATVHSLPSKNPNVFRFTASRNPGSLKIFVSIQLNHEDPEKVKAEVLEELFEEGPRTKVPKKPRLAIADDDDEDFE